MRVTLPVSNVPAKAPESTVNEVVSTASRASAPVVPFEAEALVIVTEAASVKVRLSPVITAVTFAVIEAPATVSRSTPSALISSRVTVNPLTMLSTPRAA